MWNEIKISLNCLPLLFLIWGCKQSPPPEVDPNEQAYRNGNLIHFSGRDWVVKTYENNMWGPGPNYFSGNEDDITIDSRGYLHLKIVNRNNKWMSTEVIGKDKLGYGRYRFTVEGNMDQLPANVVLGLFTWDDKSFLEAANSEVDVELGKWGNANDQNVLQFGVQPINFGTLFPERMNRPKYNTGLLNGVSTHEFNWTPDSIVWRSYTGEFADPNQQFAYWKFDKFNPARPKTENGLTSNAVVIPKPGNETNARINFWINTWISPGPLSGKTEEVVIRRFTYTRF
jgi:hypothetical protein